MPEVWIPAYAGMTVEVLPLFPRLRGGRLRWGSPASLNSYGQPQPSTE